MAAPFDTSNVSIYGQYSQYENAGSSAPTGSSRALAFLFASSSTGQAADTKLYLVNGTGSAGIVATTGEFNFAVAGDSGAAQQITDGNQLTLAGGTALDSVASATDTVTFNVNINGETAEATAADADEMLVYDASATAHRKMTRANYLGSAVAAFGAGMTTTTLSATGDVDLGDATSDTITATGRFDSDLVPSTDSARDLGTSALQWAELHVDAAHIDQLGSALDANNVAITNINVDSGAIDGANVTVGSGKTLDVSAGTLTTSAAQDLASLTRGVANNNANQDFGAFDVRGQTLTADALTATRVVFAGANGVLSDDSDMTFSGDTLTVTKLGAFEAAGAIDFSDENMTNVDIDSGAIDGTVIGAASAAAGSFTTLVAGGNVDLGDATSDTITATGRFDSDLVPSTDNARDLGAAALRYAQAHVAELHADTLGQALNGNSQNITQVAAFQSNYASGSVSVEGGLGYFTALSSSQLQDTSLTAARVVFAGANGVLSDDSDMTFSGDTLTVTKLGAYEQAGAVDFSDEAMTNVNIDSGAIDGTRIGAASAAAGSFAALDCDSLDVSDGNITNVGDIALDSISADGTSMDIELTDNQSAALEIKEGSTVYLAFSTANGSEAIMTNKAFVPGSDNAISLGGASLRYSEGHINALHADSLGQALDANSQAITNINVDSGAIDGTVIGAASAAAATVTSLVAGGDVDLGDATSDTITATGRFDSDLVPSTDSARALGSASLQWSAAHVDVGHIDQLGSALDANNVAITNVDINSGAVDGVIIGAASAAAGSFTTAAATTLAVAGGTVSGDIALALPSNKDAKARAWITYSERSLKTNIQPMNNAIDTVKKMQGVTYDLKNGGKQEVGFIADEIAQVVPEVVSFKEDGSAAGLDYGRLTSVLVEAIKAQQVQIEELSNKLNK